MNNSSALDWASSTFRSFAVSSTRYLEEAAELLKQNGRSRQRRMVSFNLTFMVVVKYKSLCFYLVIRLVILRIHFGVVNTQIIPPPTILNGSNSGNSFD